MKCEPTSKLREAISGAPKAQDQRSPGHAPWVMKTKDRSTLNGLCNRGRCTRLTALNPLLDLIPGALPLATMRMRRWRGYCVKDEFLSLAPLWSLWDAIPLAARFQEYDGTRRLRIMPEHPAIAKV